MEGSVRTPTTDLGGGVDESAYPRADICLPHHSILDEAGPQRGVNEPCRPRHRVAEHWPLPARERKALVVKVGSKDARVHSRG
jgi:hypothetical protein